jgi:hypothetical protein
VFISECKFDNTDMVETACMYSGLYQAFYTSISELVSARLTKCVEENFMNFLSGNITVIYVQ